MFRGNTKFIDFLVLFEWISLTGKSGLLHLHSLDKKNSDVFAYFSEGQCVLVGDQEVELYLIDHFIDQFTTDEILKNKIQYFVTEHPYYYIDALNMLNITTEQIVKQLIKVRNSLLFNNLFNEDIEFTYYNTKIIEQIILKNYSINSLVDFILKEKPITEELTNFIIKLSAFPMIKVQTKIEYYVKDSLVEINEFLNGEKTFREITKRVSPVDVYDFYNFLTTKEQEGILVFDISTKRQFKAFSGTEKIIKTTSEIYETILNLFFNDSPNRFNGSNPSVIFALNKASLYYPNLFIANMDAVDNVKDFINCISENVSNIIPEEKTSLYKKGLNTFLFFLFNQIQSTYNEEFYREKSQRATGFLKFIKSQGTFTQKEVSFQISNILNLVRAVFVTGLNLTTPKSEVSSTEDPRVEQINALFAQGKVLEAYLLLKNGISDLSSLFSLDFKDEIEKEAKKFLQKKIGYENTIVKLASIKSLDKLNEIKMDNDEAYILYQLEIPISIKDLIEVTNLSLMKVYIKLHHLINENLVTTVEPSKIKIQQERNIKVQSVSYQIASTEPNADLISASSEEISSEEIDKITSQLNAELAEMKILLPHEIFGLKQDSNENDFKTTLSFLKDRFTNDRFPKEAHPNIETILEKINNYIDEAAKQLTTFFKSDAKSVSYKTADSIISSKGHIKENKSNKFSENTLNKEREKAILIQSENKGEAKINSEAQGFRKINISNNEKKPKDNNGKIARQKKSQTYCLKAKKLIRKKQYDEAIECFEKAIRLTPLNYSIHRERDLAIIDRKQYFAEDAFKRAQKFLQEGKAKIAVKLIKEALNHDPTKPEYFIGLSKIMSEEFNRIKEAEYYCRKAIEMEPGNVYNYLFLGKMFKASGKILEAREEFQEALKWDKNNREVKREINLLP